MAGTRGGPGNDMAKTAPLTSTPLPNQGLAQTAPLTSTPQPNHSFAQTAPLTAMTPLPNFPSTSYVYRGGASWGPQWTITPGHVAFPPPAPAPQPEAPTPEEELFMMLVAAVLVAFDDYKMAVGFLVGMMRHIKAERALAGRNVNQHEAAVEQHASNASAMHFQAQSMRGSVAGG